jgi:sensor domain CHASE-containing protein
MVTDHLVRSGVPKWLQVPGAIHGKHHGQLRGIVKLVFLIRIYYIILVVVELMTQLQKRNDYDVKVNANVKYN